MRRVYASARVLLVRLLPAILTRTDLIALVPSTAGRVMFPGDDIAYVKPPFAIPDIAVAIVWHERNDLDPALKWLRDEVATLFEGHAPNAGRDAEARKPPPTR